MINTVILYRVTQFETESKYFTPSPDVKQPDTNEEKKDKPNTGHSFPHGILSGLIVVSDTWCCTLTLLACPDPAHGHISDWVYGLWSYDVNNNNNLSQTNFVAHHK